MARRLSQRTLKLVLVQLLLYHCTCSAEVNGILTLADAVKRGLAQDSAVTRSVLAELISQKDVEISRAAFSPRLEGQLGSLFTSSSLSPSSPHEPSFLGANAIWEHKALLVLTGQLDTSGSLRAGVHKSKAQKEVASADTMIAKLDLGLLLSQTYLEASFAKQKRELSEQLLETAVQLRMNTQMRLSAGEVARVDLVKAELQESLAQDQLSQALTTEETTRHTLLSLLCMEPGSEPNLLALGSLLQEADKSTPVADLGHDRPILKKLDSQARSAEADLELAKAELRPQLNYSLRSGLITDGFGNSSIPQHLGVEGLISVSFPLFDGGTSALKQEQARLRLEQVETDRRITERQIDADRRNALTKLSRTRNRMENLAAELPQARKNFEISYARYKAGEAQIVEVTDAQNSLTNFSQAHLQAVYDYLAAQIVYQRTIGLVPGL